MAKLHELEQRFQSLIEFHRVDESSLISAWLKAYQTLALHEEEIHLKACEITETIQQQSDDQLLDKFLHLYHLSSEEGIALMCIAEALLRIKHPQTQIDFIREKLSEPQWLLNESEKNDFWMNAGIWSILLTRRLLSPLDKRSGLWKKSLDTLLKKTSQPVIQMAMQHAMQILGSQFVMGESIHKALSRAKKMRPTRFSYDMLGEGARTHADATRYFKAYQDAIDALGQTTDLPELHQNDSISIKLSALHPHYHMQHHNTVVEELGEKVLQLALQAQKAGIALTIDAEEADRLLLSLMIFEKVYTNASLASYHGLGLAVQAYQKRVLAVIDWLASLSQRQGKVIPIRVVKGAYWDSEIKWAQEQGVSDYPVFTKKSHTDLAYLMAAARLQHHGPNCFYPQMATHNAHTIVSVMDIFQDMPYEFQGLHGMGFGVHEIANAHCKKNIPLRVYAPVGNYADLLPYLVRRLLENGANASFVHQIKMMDAKTLAQSPYERIQQSALRRHANIPLPEDLYGEGRKNAKGFDIHCPHRLNEFFKYYSTEKALYTARTQTPVPLNDTTATPCYSPNLHQRCIGYVHETPPEALDEILLSAKAGYQEWHQTTLAHRASSLRTLADLLERDFQPLMELLILEAGKVLDDAVAEVRESIDFCRYYAKMGLETLNAQPLPGPTGEKNMLYLKGRGVWLTISPWNFPLAIFLGQVTAALMAGNAVIAKPAEQTPLIAHKAAELLYEAGIPKAVFQLVLGGRALGATLVAKPGIDGIAFTGSTHVAWKIQHTLAEKKGPIIPFIAETGGQNAMLVDATALPEQVIDDVIHSAFGSCGQRCSALRLLLLQEEIADPILNMLTGAMEALTVGSSEQLNTDVGPCIDAQAKLRLIEHVDSLDKFAKFIASTPLSTEQEKLGHYFAPIAYELLDIAALTEEHFGPILHVYRYRASELPNVLAKVRELGFGLTFGIHSRRLQFANDIACSMPCGNIYINRAMTGAIVGSQPFGGQGLSGTGPKAGGPHYLLRFCHEQVHSINVTATGGNVDLLALDEELLASATPLPIH